VFPFCAVSSPFSDASNNVKNGSVIGTAPAQEVGNANFLAIHKTTGQFYDIAGDQKMDFVCQYRAPAPCSEGYRYFSPAGLDANNEYGMASCVKVFPTPTTLVLAQQKCGLLKAQPVNNKVVYAHLATYHNVLGGTATPLTAFVKRMAQRLGAGPRFWTGGQLLLTGSDFIPNWQDLRPFDSTLNQVATPPDASSSDGCVFCIVCFSGLASTLPVKVSLFLHPCELRLCFFFFLL
jgi:hypothetical protein